MDSCTQVEICTAKFMTLNDMNSPTRGKQSHTQDSKPYRAAVASDYKNRVAFLRQPRPVAIKALRWIYQNTCFFTPAFPMYSEARLDCHALRRSPTDAVRKAALLEEDRFFGANQSDCHRRFIGNKNFEGGKAVNKHCLQRKETPGHPRYHGLEIAYEKWKKEKKNVEETLQDQAWDYMMGENEKYGNMLTVDDGVYPSKIYAAEALGYDKNIVFVGRMNSKLGPYLVQPYSYLNPDSKQQITRDKCRLIWLDPDLPDKIRNHSISKKKSSGSFDSIRARKLKAAFIHNQAIDLAGLIIKSEIQFNYETGEYRTIRGNIFLDERVIEMLCERKAKIKANIADWENVSSGDEMERILKRDMGLAGTSRHTVRRPETQPWFESRFKFQTCTDGPWKGTIEVVDKWAVDRTEGISIADQAFMGGCHGTAAVASTAKAPAPTRTQEDLDAADTLALLASGGSGLESRGVAAIVSPEIFLEEVRRMALETEQQAAAFYYSTPPPSPLIATSSLSCSSSTSLWPSYSEYSPLSRPEVPSAPIADMTPDGLIFLSSRERYRESERLREMEREEERKRARRRERERKREREGERERESERAREMEREGYLTDAPSSANSNTLGAPSRTPLPSQALSPSSRARLDGDSDAEAEEPRRPTKRRCTGR